MSLSVSSAHESSVPPDVYRPLLYISIDHMKSDRATIRISGEEIKTEKIQKSTIIRT